MILMKNLKLLFAACLTVLTFNSAAIVAQTTVRAEPALVVNGSMLDGTYGAYTTRGAFSFNGIVGVNVAKKNSVRVDVAGLIGGREKTTDCPASFLGYACYANEPPSRSFYVNYGGIVSFSFKRLMVGARVTGASTQGLVGIRF